MDDIFREFGLMRDKWDADRSDRTYGERILNKALEGRTEFYGPDRAIDIRTPPADSVDSALTDALLEPPGLLKQEKSHSSILFCVMRLAWTGRPLMIKKVKVKLNKTKGIRAQTRD